MDSTRSQHGRKFQVTAGLDLEQIEYVELRAEQDNRHKADIIRRAVDVLRRLEPITAPEKVAS